MSSPKVLHACIKWLEGPEMNEIQSVTSDCIINHTFSDGTNFDKLKKYKVQNSSGVVYRAQICALKNTKKEIDDITTKSRLKQVPKNRLHSSSESDIRQKKPKKSQTKKDKNLDQLSRIVSIKKETLQKIISAKPSTKASNKNDKSSPAKNTAKVSPLDAASTSNSSSNPRARLPLEDPLQNDAHEKSNNSDSDISNEKEINSASPFEPESSMSDHGEAIEQDMQGSNEISKNSHLTGKSQQSTDESTVEIRTPSGFTSTVEDSVKVVNETRINRSLSLILKTPEDKENSQVQRSKSISSTPSASPLSSNSANVIGNDSEEQNAKKTSSQRSKEEKTKGGKTDKPRSTGNITKDNSKDGGRKTSDPNQSRKKGETSIQMTTEKAKTDLKELKHEHESLRKRYEATKKELKVVQKENERYKKLNFDLQTEVIEVFKEQSVIEKQLKGSTSKATDAATVNADHNFVPVGYHKKSDDTYHIGHSVWLKSVQFNNIMYNSKTPRKCVGNTLISLFDLRTLLVSTATGKLSNNTLGKLKKGGANVDDAKCEKLDPSKLAAAKSLYNYWLDQEYVKFPNVTEAMCFQEITSFHDHVSAEIAYLKRDTKPKKGAPRSKGKKRSASTDNTVAPKKAKNIGGNEDTIDLEESADPSDNENRQVQTIEDKNNKTKDNENLDDEYDDEIEETFTDEETARSYSSTCSIKTSELVSSEEE